MEDNFLLCGTVLHVASLAPARKMTVVPPDHCDKKKPTKLSRSHSTGGTASIEDH